MTKSYVKDSNGKYKLVEVDNTKETKPTEEQRAAIREVFQTPKIKELDDRLRRVEAILFPQEGNKK